MSARMLPVVLRVLGTAAACGALVLLHLWAESRRAYRSAVAGEEEGAWLTAVDAYETCAKQWFPGNQFADGCVRRLLLVSQTAQIRGDAGLAYDAAAAARRAVHAVSAPVGGPSPLLVQQVEHHWKRAAERYLETGDRSGDGEVHGARSRFSEPSTLWSLALTAGLLVWALGAFAATMGGGRVRWWALGVSSGGLALCVAAAFLA